MKYKNQLSELHESITREIVDMRNQEMAESIATKRKNAKEAEERYQIATKAIEAMGLKVASLDALDREITAQREKDLLTIQTQMEALSQEPKIITDSLEIEATFLPQDAYILKPAWVGTFSDDDAQDELTSSTTSITTQTLLTGGGCKNYYNWAKGGGSGLFGTGVGKIQSWIDFGFWFLPPVSRFYSVVPLFRFRGYIIVQADDGFFTSKYARVIGSAWTNVYQYNWKGWNHVNVYDVRGDNINVNRREDIDRYTYNSYLLGGGDWMYIRCTIGLYAYARGGGSYAKNDFSTGTANYLCVPQCYVY